MHTWFKILKEQKVRSMTPLVLQLTRYLLPRSTDYDDFLIDIPEIFSAYINTSINIHSSVFLYIPCTDGNIWRILLCTLLSQITYWDYLTISMHLEVHCFAAVCHISLQHDTFNQSPIGGHTGCFLSFVYIINRVAMVSIVHMEFCTWNWICWVKGICYFE